MKFGQHTFCDGWLNMMTYRLTYWLLLLLLLLLLTKYWLKWRLMKLLQGHFT